MNVFVLGAGTSFPAGFPLGKGLMGELRSFVSGFRHQGGPYGPILQAWEELEKQGVLNPADDLELNLSNLDIEMVRLAHRARRGEEVDPLDPRTVRGQMGKVLFDYLFLKHSEIARSPEKTEYLSAFLRNHLADGDAILTFNYDCLIEKSLSVAGRWTLRDGYGLEMQTYYPNLQEEADSKCLVVKLHGSLGWMTSIDRLPAVATDTPRFGMGTPGEDLELLIQRTVLDYLGYASLEMRDAELRRATFNPMALPSYLKNLSVFPLPQLWKLAAELLRGADRVVVCGYSFPNSDSAARTLFHSIPRGRTIEYFWYEEDVQRVEALRKFFEQAGIGFTDRYASIEALAQSKELPTSRGQRAILDV